MHFLFLPSLGINYFFAFYGNKIKNKNRGRKVVWGAGANVRVPCVGTEAQDSQLIKRVSVSSDSESSNACEVFMWLRYKEQTGRR